MVDWLASGLHWRALIGGTRRAGSAARPPGSSSLAGLLVVAAACLDSAWTGTLAPGSPAERSSSCFGCVLGLWLAVDALRVFPLDPDHAVLPAAGIVVGIIAIGVAILGWSALETRNSRRGLVTLIVIAVGLKLAHWGYYVPEWNYRYSQGPGVARSASGSPRDGPSTPSTTGRPTWPSS